MKTIIKKRSRVIYSAILVTVILLGLASRKFGSYLPNVVAEYSGDTLWALMIFIGIGLLFPKRLSIQVALWALSLCFIIELSQLYHADWIDAIRHTQIGGLILGFGFLWSDLICYSSGIAIGFAAELKLLKISNKNKVLS